jgi:hypothetical protein
MEVYIFILCYNEEVLLPHTIAHYRANIPDCHIIIYDNMSTDNSVKIAKEFGCAVIQWKSDGIDDHKYLKIKNNCWRHIKNGWILCIDMDEWLCVTDDELLEEYLNGTTVLKIKGVNMIGDSKTITLEDINLHSLKFGVKYILESKHLCFYIPDIKTVKYTVGAHTANFTGNIKYSKKIYINKHMELLGLPFYLNKKNKRRDRAIGVKNILTNCSPHYSPNAYIHKKRYLNSKANSKNIFNDQNKKDKKLFQLLFNKLLQLII